MFIRFFKENDLIGCGGDTQPIRLQVGTLSQSDYRWGPPANQITGVCAGVAHAEVVGTLSQSVEPIRVTCTVVAWKGCAHRGCAHSGCACNGCVCRGGGDTQPISGANQVCACRGCACSCCMAKVASTMVAHAGVAHTGVVGTLSQSGLHVQGLHTQWLHSQGLHVQGLHT